jgi:hypothetical protein
MKTCYLITFSVDLGNVIPEIGDLTNRVNASMASGGYDYKLQLTHCGIIPPMTLTVDRELTNGEQETMKNIILGELCKAFPKFDVRVSEFRRQSGNVQQSIS